MGQTLFQKRQAKAARRAANLAAGLCIECGIRPPAMTKKDGLGKTCLDCRTPLKRRVGNESKPVIRRDADGDEIDIRDSPEFKAITLAVRRFIEREDERGGKKHKGVTLGLISRILNISPDLVSMALRMLEVQHAGLVPERYTYIDRRVRVVPKSEWPSDSKPAPYVPPIDPKSRTSLVPGGWS